jgi:hypothetical protein
MYHGDSPIYYTYKFRGVLKIIPNEDDMITDLFQPPRDGLLQHSHDGFWSYPRSCDIYPFEHLDQSYEEGFQPYLCPNFDENGAVICS